jgi:hypothetical protein
MPKSKKEATAKPKYDIHKLQSAFGTLILTMRPQNGPWMSENEYEENVPAWRYDTNRRRESGRYKRTRVKTVKIRRKKSAGDMPVRIPAAQLLLWR